MNSRERVEAALRHSEPDRTPIFEYELQSPSADVLLGRPFLSDWMHWVPAVGELGFDGALRQLATDQVELAARLGHDMLYVHLPARPTGSASPFHVERTEGALDGDPVERLARRVDEASQYDARIPEERMALLDYLAEAMRERGLDLPMLVPAYAHGVWADTDLMMTMCMAPEVARSHFALCTKQAITMVNQYLERGLKLIGVGGDFAGDRPVISPALYREMIVPEVASVSRHIHAAGGHAVNASDGNLWSVIDDFLVGCEVDGYIEIDFRAGMDLRRLKPAYGDRVTFFGNVDCANVLSFGTPDQVRSHTIEVIEAGQGHGGHILCASNAVMASVPLPNYVAMQNAYRDYFGLEGRL